jgi:hypothetical protein
VYGILQTEQTILAVEAYHSGVTRGGIVQETFIADMLSESLCKAIGVVRISKTDGASKLLERVDALLPPA